MRSWRIGRRAVRHEKTRADAQQHERQGGEKRVPQRVTEARDQARQKFGGNLAAGSGLKKILRIGEFVPQRWSYL